MHKAERCKELPEVILITPSFGYRDHRGDIVALYEEQEFRAALMELQIIPPTFVKDNISISQRNVLRGIHGDFKTWKLVGCLDGLIFLVVVDCRGEYKSDMTGKSFGQWVGFNLIRNMILVPPGFGVAHLVLTETAIFWYKWSEPYGNGKQFTYRYDDSRFNIRWPEMPGEPILSERDAKAGEHI